MKRNTLITILLIVTFSNANCVQDSTLTREYQYERTTYCILFDDAINENVNILAECICNCLPDSTLNDIIEEFEINGTSIFFLIKINLFGMTKEASVIRNDLKSITTEQIETCCRYLIDNQVYFYLDYQVYFDCSWEGVEEVKHLQSVDGDSDRKFNYCLRFPNRVITRHIKTKFDLQSLRNYLYNRK